MSVPLARRQLLASPGRTVAAALGIAVALLLVLALRAIFAGMEQRLTVFVDRSGADVIVAQRGVQTMHMTQSTVTDAAVAAVARVPGVRQATPILSVSTLLERRSGTSVVYLIGDPRRRVHSGGVVVDASLGAPNGERVAALGHTFRVVGRQSGTASIANSLAFVDYEELGRVLRRSQLPSYVLVRAAEGVEPAELARRIDRAVPTVTASTRGTFARSERRVVGDMSTGIVRAMTLVAFGVGVGIAALVAYTLMLSQLRELAALRALGLRTRDAVTLVVTEVGALVGLGLGGALGLVVLLAAVLPRLSATLALSLRGSDVLVTVVVAGGVALVSALYPVVRVARVDPATAFRR